MKYIKFRDHQKSAANKIVDTGSPVITEIDGKREVTDPASIAFF